MSEQPEVRKMSKKTITIITILAIMGIIGMFVIKNGKSQKATKILYALGITNVKDVTVFSKTEFVNEGTNVKGYQYALKFINLSTNKVCQGFIIKDFKGNIAKDLDCK